MKNIKVLGTGCRNCQTTYEPIRQVAEAKGAAIELEQALDDCSLAHWADRREALANRSDQARLAAARKLMPTVRRVSLPSRPLNSADEV